MHVCVVHVVQVSSTGDVLEMSVVRGVGRVCDMCMRLARAVWVERGLSA